MILSGPIPLKAVKMIQSHPSHSHSMLELVSVRAVGSFMPDQMDATTAVLTEVQGWAVDQHVDYDGNVMIVASHDTSGQTFFLSGTPAHVELARMHGDRMVSCGTFDCIEAALETLLRAASRERT